MQRNGKFSEEAREEISMIAKIKPVVDYLKERLDFGVTLSRFRDEHSKSPTESDQVAQKHPAEVQSPHESSAMKRLEHSLNGYVRDL